MERTRGQLPPLFLRLLLHQVRHPSRTFLNSKAGRNKVAHRYLLGGTLNLEVVNMGNKSLPATSPHLRQWLWGLLQLQFQKVLGVVRGHLQQGAKWEVLLPCHPNRLKIPRLVPAENHLLYVEGMHHQILVILMLTQHSVQQQSLSHTTISSSSSSNNNSRSRTYNKDNSSRICICKRSHPSQPATLQTPVELPIVVTTSKGDNQQNSNNSSNQDRPTLSSGMLTLSPSLTLAGATNDPTKAAQAAAAAANMKGGLPPPGLLQVAQYATQTGGHQFMSAAFPYLHSVPGVQVKPSEQKQPAGNDNLRASWQPEKR